jgi:group I intron endonuclease
VVVYKISSTKTPRVYVGITTGAIEKRWREHKCAANTGSARPLYRAMRLYGVDTFSIQVIDEAVTQEELREKEIWHISQLKSHVDQSGYNLTDHGFCYGCPTKPKGEDVYRSLLTDKCVAYIRSVNLLHLTNDDLVVELLSKFGVSASRDCVRDARKGKSWKHLNATHPPVVKRQGFNSKPRTQRQIDAEAHLKTHRAKAIAVAKEVVGSRVNPRSKLSPEHVLEIHQSALSLTKLAAFYGVSKRLVLLIKQAKIHKHTLRSLVNA